LFPIPQAWARYLFAGREGGKPDGNEAERNQAGRLPPSGWLCGME
jgi:hypothetical protein